MGLRVLVLVAALGMALVAGAAGARAEPLRYVVKPSAGDRLELIVEKTGLMSGKKHVFVFPEYEAELQYDAASPASAAITLKLQAARITCEDDWVNAKDLKKIEAEARDKMLDARAHPVISFRSTGIRARGGTDYVAEGMLRIRHVEKPVLVNVSLQPAGEGLAFRGEAVVDMTAWGLKPPSAALGTVGTNKLMQFRFRFTARRAADSVAPGL